MYYAHQFPMDLQMIGVCFLFLSSTLARECTYSATFIRRENVLFDSKNYGTVCFEEEEEDYNGPITWCSGKAINPKCVCAYDLYDFENPDLCSKYDARKNGSLKHVDVKFCQTYSYNKNGPCQNGGTLKDTGDLAIDAKCECKDGYSGDFCDIVNKAILCSESKEEMLKDLDKCTKMFVTYPGRSSCSLTLDGYRHFICDSQKNVTDGAKDCSSSEYTDKGRYGKPNENDTTNGKSPLSGSRVLLVCLVVLLRRLVYGDVF